jgi:hypothetical protein
MKTPSKELCFLVAQQLEALTVEERSTVAMFAVGYGLETPFAVSADAAITYLKMTNQLRRKTTVEMPPVRSAEDEAATVNADGFTYECLCRECGKQFSLRHKNAPAQCRACERKEAV